MVVVVDVVVVVVDVLVVVVVLVVGTKVVVVDVVVVVTVLGLLLLPPQALKSINVSKKIDNEGIFFIFPLKNKNLTTSSSGNSVINMVTQLSTKRPAAFRPCLSTSLALSVILVGTQPNSDNNLAGCFSQIK